MRIELKKLQPTQITLIVFVLEYYLKTTTQPKKDVINDMYRSIAQELFYTIRKKVVNPLFQKTYSLKFPYHEAMVLIAAFVKFQTDHKGDDYLYEVNVIEILKNNLSEQMA